MILTHSTSEDRWSVTEMSKMVMNIGFQYPNSLTGYDSDISDIIASIVDTFTKQSKSIFLL